MNDYRDAVIEELAASEAELLDYIATLEGDLAIYRDFVHVLLNLLQTWQTNPVGAARSERQHLDALRALVRDALLTEVTPATERAA